MIRAASSFFDAVDFSVLCWRKHHIDCAVVIALITAFMEVESFFLQMVDEQMDKALVLEDDIRFQANFKRRALRLMEEVEQVELDWDIM